MLIFLKGEFAIDDIIIHEGKSISTDLCDFESDSCGYKKIVFNGLNWEIGNGTYLNKTSGISIIDVKLFLNLFHCEIFRV